MARRRSAALVAALGFLGLAVASAPTSAAPRPAAVLPTPAETSPRLAAVHSFDTVSEVRVVAPPPPEPEVEIGIAALADAPPIWGPASTVTPGGPITVGAPRGVDASVRYAGEGKELWDRIVYVGGVATDDDVQQDGDVYLFTEEGDDVRLTCSPGRETHPVVSPDARWVAFATEVDGTWDVARVPFRTDGPCDPAAVELLAASGTADETWPAWVDETHLVFSSAAEGGLADLFLWIEGREEPTRLTDHPGDDTQPAVTRTGDPYHVAFTSTRFRPAGSIAFLRLTDGFLDAADDASELPVPEVTQPWGPQPRQGMEATWTQSNVNRWLAFTSTDGDGRGDLWIAGLTDETDSGALELLGERPLVVTPGVAESHPMWFALEAPTEEEGWSATLWYTQELPETAADDVVSDDGSDPRTILGDGPLAPPTDTPAYEAGVDYSPDGTRVALSERTPDPPGDPPPGLALVLRDAATLEPVPFGYARDDVDADVDPVWSPDGTMLAFVRWTWTPDGYTGPRLWLVDADGTEARPLTEAWTPMDDQYVEVDPAWSPDSAQIVYAASYGTYSTDPLPLLVAPVQDDGTGPRQLTATETETCGCQVSVVGRSPDWSPSGAQVVAADVEVQPTFEEGGVIAALVAPTRPMRGELAVLEVGWPEASSEVSDVTALAGFTFDEPPAPTPNRDEVMGADDPEWSPDGAEIAFTGVRPGQPWRLRDVYAVPFPATDTARRVTGLAVTEHEPAYQPWTDVVLTLASPPLADDRTTTLTATVTNGGPGLAAGGVVTIDLPDGGTSAGAPGCTTAGDEVTCRLTDPLERGGTEAFSVPVSLVGVATATTTTVGVVTTESPERVVDNNRASVDLGDPGRDGGVGVQLSISTGTAWVGGLPVQATFTVRNAGTTPAQDVQVTTAYPASLVPTGLAPCPAPSGTCALGTLSGGAAVVLNATLDPSVVFEGPPQLGAVTASVATTSPDPDPADDTASATIEIHRPTLTVSPGVARPGEVVFVTGTDFPPGADVSQAWSVGIMGGPGALRADDGRFQSAVPLIADTLLGPRGLRAASPAPTPLFGPVETTLLVVATSAQAPSFLFRR